ncbi:MAG: glutathione synthase [Pseudomonadota bacterium]
MDACFIIDPIDTLTPKKDTSLDLAMEAQRRGHGVYVCTAEDVYATPEGLHAKAQRLEMRDELGAEAHMDPTLFTLSEPAPLALDTCGAVFVRKDPPFDVGYLTLCLLLDTLGEHVRLVNPGRALRLISEKLTALRFPDVIPNTLVSYDPQTVREFATRYDKVVLKPCYMGGGVGIVMVSADDPMFQQKCETILALEPHGPIIAQEFVAQASGGDTRVMIVDGEIVGAVGRRPPEGEFRANVAVGGTEAWADLTPVQTERAAKIGEFLREHNVLFAGLDFIGDHLIEMNVTSPTLVKELKRVGGPDVSKLIWDRIEAGAV